MQTRKLLAILIAAVMVFALLPASLFAATTVSNVVELTSALASGGEIILGANIDAGTLTAGYFFKVGSDKTVALDLNGYTLQGARVDGSFSGSNRNTSIIENNGTLTIKDSVGTGKIVISASNNDGWSSCTACVSNSGGTLTIESGTLQNLGGTDMAYAVDNLSGAGVATVTVNGGTIKSDNYIGLRLFANSATQLCGVTVNNGTIYGLKRGIWIHQPSAGLDGLAIVTINGGTITGKMQSAVMADLYGDDGVEIYIKGGQLTNASNTHATLLINPWNTGDPNAGGGHVEIRGGQFVNGGTAGNLATQTVIESVIVVYKGVFSETVPSQFVVANADIKIANSVVTANADVTYTVIITPSVDFGTIHNKMGIQTKNFIVSVEGAFIKAGATITVKNTTPEADMVMKEIKDANVTLPFQLTPPTATGFVFSGNGSITGHVTCNPSTDLTAPGSYKGFMTFSVTYTE